jgi:hypothetical protein
MVKHSKPRLLSLMIECAASSIGMPPFMPNGFASIYRTVQDLGKVGKDKDRGVGCSRGKLCISVQHLYAARGLSQTSAGAPRRPGATCAASSAGNAS